MNNFYQSLSERLEQTQSDGLYKEETIITSSQNNEINISQINDKNLNHENSKTVLNFCANNYLGLANNQDLIKSAKEGLQEYGFGVASVRFICGTQDIHKNLERELANFLQCEDTILYTSCFDANTALFETILGKEDAIISDRLNHASIIDGIRLCKAKRYLYQNNNMEELKNCLIDATKNKAKNILIVTDGVFSMDGVIANLSSICDLADEFGALVMVDDSHAVGFMGKNGRGTPEHHNVMDRVDIVTGTLGKAMGGASGGYTAGKKILIDTLRQYSRPYLFSNSLAPAIVTASLEVLKMLSSSNELQNKLHDNAQYFRHHLTDAGFSLSGADHPIIPIMLYDAKVSGEFAKRCMQKRIFVVSFSYPVVPQETARIRTQMSAAHSRQDLDKAITTFIQIGKEMKII